MKINFLKVWCFLFFVSISFISNASNEIGDTDLTKTFKPAQVAGDLPKVYSWSKEMYQTLPFDHLTASGIERKKKEAFQALYRANLYELFWSGNVLFGDEFSVYLNKVKDQILESNQLSQLKYEVTCYAWKTSQKVPKTLIDGSILIPINLISKLENEAQLGFLVSHEIATYQQIKDTEYALFLNTTGSLKQKIGLYDILSEFNTTFEKNESVSDLKGYELFKKSNYNQEDALDLLLIMQFSSLDYETRKITPEFFNTSMGELPASYFENLSGDMEKSVAEIEETKEASKYESRIEKLSELLNFKEGKKFIVNDKAHFDNLAVRAKFENQLIHVEEKKFIKTIKESYSLLKVYPENEFLKDCLIQSLYSLAKKEKYFSLKRKNKKTYFQSKQTYSKSNKAEEKDAPTLNAIESLIDNTSAKSLRFVVINYIQQNGGEKHQKYADDLLFDLIHIAGEDLTSFSVSATKNPQNKKDSSNKTIQSSNSLTVPAKEPEVKKVVFDPIDSLGYIELSKIEKINYQRKLKKYNDYIQYLADKKIKDSLDNVIANSDNMDSLDLSEEQLDRLDKIKENKKDLADNNFMKTSIDNWKKEASFWKRIETIEKLKSDLNYRKHVLGISENQSNTGRKLDKKIDIDSILCEEPVYKVYDDRRIAGKVKYKEQDFKNEGLKKSLAKAIKEKTEHSDVAFVTGQNEQTVETVQTILNINKWKEKHDFSSSDYNQFPPLTEYYSESELSSKYHYILYTKINSERISRSVMVLAVGLVSFVAAPLALGVYITPKYKVYKTIEIKNLEGVTVYKKTIHPKNRPNIILDQLFVEDVINQVSGK